MIWSEHTVAPYAYRRGGSPLIVSMPHAGTFIPPSLAQHFTDVAACRPDTDWHLPRLYDFVAALDATVIRAQVSRYVVDFNRPPDGANLYPGQDTPRLCPVDTFARQPLYRGEEPQAAEIHARVQRHWQPYHLRLAAEIARVKAEHGVAILWDAHSIAARVPRLFEGRLPDFNLGTAAGRACAPELAHRLHVALARHTGFTCALDGRFQGGHITRAFGRPQDNVHAVQLEMVTATYMTDASPYTFDSTRAAAVRPILREQLQIALDWAKQRTVSTGRRATR